MRERERERDGEMGEKLTPDKDSHRITALYLQAIQHSGLTLKRHLENGDTVYALRG